MVITMELAEALRTRRTVRAYQNLDVPDLLIEDLLRESTRAPSACNIRGWRFLVIRDQKQMRWLYESGSASFISDAPQAVLVCYDNRTDNSEWSDFEQSAAAAITCFQLLAHERGIGSCWICHLPSRNEICRHFSIPVGYTPIALVSFGYYLSDHMPKPRNLANDCRVVAFEKWDFDDEPKCFTSVLPLLVRKAIRRIYYLLPRRGWLRKYALKYEKKF